jgi:hypothetical protein
LADIPWPPLDHKPLTERYGVLKPIAKFKAPKEGKHHHHKHHEH